MPEFHAEPYLHLAGLSHKSALITWGAFYFKARSRGAWKLVDDSDLRHVHPPRAESIGARSDPYGPARVNVYDMSDTLVASSFVETCNYCWVTGLTPDTRYKMYLKERLGHDEASGRASVDPGLFYRFRYGRDVEFICLDTSKESFWRRGRLFEYPKHWEWIEQTFSERPARWRIVFCHHPPFTAGPQHSNTDHMEKLLPLFARGGVRVVFSGHEHNFQHARADGIDYFVSGAGSKVRKGAPHDFDRARTVSWSDNAHFLLVTIRGDELTVRPIGELVDGGIEEIPRFSPSHEKVGGPLVVRL